MPTTEAAILERIIELEQAELTPEAARYLLTLDFSEADRQRLSELDAKAHAGALTAAEQTDREHYRHVHQLLERMRSKARQILQGAAEPSPPPSFEVAPGILRSQEAFWRDLPELLKNKRNYGKWVCYHGDERLGLGEFKDLIRECNRRGLDDSEYDLFIIRERDIPPWEPEEVEDIGPWHFSDVPPDA